MADRADFSADDLALLGNEGGDAGDAAGGDAGGDKTTDKGGDQGGDKAAKDAGAKGAEGAEAKGSDKGGDPVAAGGDEVKDKQAPAYWPKDWREKAAEHAAAGDKKAYERELRRLQRIADPSGLYGMYRELEGKFSEGGLLKVPGKGAKPEDVAAFHKALGVPEKPEEYLKDIKLSNGAVIGEADKPVVDAFAQAMHKTGAPPPVVHAALDWYYKHQEEQAAAQDEADDAFRREALAELKDEYGPSFKRNTNAIASLFAQAPGGADIKNDDSLFAQLMGGRLANGQIIGNDPKMVRWLVNLAQDVNPASLITEDGDQGGQSVDNEIAAIEKRMKEDRRGYFKDEAAQQRYRQLLDARDKIRARAR